MSEFNDMGWKAKMDELELKVDPQLMPLVISIRADLELFASVALKYTEMGALALKQRQHIMDAEAVLAEWSDD